MRSNFIRKLVYMGLALALFVVILQVRKPIERIRAAEGLSETTLGNVDPTSSTMVLVLGGMRGIAVNFLWSQALELQKNQDWYAYEPIVESIIKLQPHFVRVWTFQGWNLAYNITADWDQVEDKYYWIKHGIKFLRRGTAVNDDSPELRWDVGWTYFHKIGKADEAVLLRKIFQQDDKPEIDAQGRAQPAFNQNNLDNYIASLEWFQKAVAKCDEPPIKKPKRMGEVAFRSYPAHAQTNSVQAEEEEGLFSEGSEGIAARWLIALQLWRDFADFEYTYAEPQRKVKLDYTPDIFGDLYRSVTLMTRIRSLDFALPKDWNQTDPRELVEHTRLVWSDQTAADLEKLSPDEKTKAMTDWAVGVWDMIARDTPRLLAEFGQPTIDILPAGAGEALVGVRSAFEKLKALDVSVLARDDAEGERVRKQIAELAEPAEKLGALAHEELYWCDRYSTMINYRYWKERTVAESEPDTIAARQLFFTGLESFREGDPETAHTKLKEGLDLWKKVLDKFTRLRDDDLTVEETVKVVMAYKHVRDQLEMPPLSPEDTPFQEFILKVTPHEPTPEEYQEMMKYYQESQKTGGGMDPMKKDMMEKYRDALKLEGDAPPQKPTVPTKPDDSPKKD
jgi:hypothetical protein